MSSPFQSAFMARSPLAELSAKQKTNLSLEHQEAILEKTPDETPSPLGNHGDEMIAKAKRISRRDGESGDYNYASDKVMKLKTEGEKLNNEHNDEDETGDPSNEKQ